MTKGTITKTEDSFVVEFTKIELDEIVRQAASKALEGIQKGAFSKITYISQDRECFPAVKVVVTEALTPPADR